MSSKKVYKPKKKKLPTSAIKKIAKNVIGKGGPISIGVGAALAYPEIKAIGKPMLSDSEARKQGYASAQKYREALYGQIKKLPSVVAGNPMEYLLDMALYSNPATGIPKFMYDVSETPGVIEFNKKAAKARERKRGQTQERIKKKGIPKKIKSLFRPSKEDIFKSVKQTKLREELKPKSVQNISKKPKSVFISSDPVVIVKPQEPDRNIITHEIKSNTDNEQNITMEPQKEHAPPIPITLILALVIGGAGVLNVLTKRRKK